MVNIGKKSLSRLSREQIEAQMNCFFLHKSEADCDHSSHVFVFFVFVLSTNYTTTFWLYNVL